MFNTIHLDKLSQTPLYLQLANGLSTFIEGGQLPPGTKLPSIRSLAKELRINRDTVVSAYKALEQRNLTYGYPGRGTYVATPTIVTHEHTLVPPISQSFSLANKSLINFSSTFPGDDYCPIEIFENIFFDILKKDKWDAFHDYNGSNLKNLLKEVYNYFLQNNVLCTINQIKITRSLDQLIQALPKFSSKTGVCVESPSKGLFLFKQYGFQVYEVTLEPDGMNLEILEEYLKSGHIQYIYLMPYLQNPTGICYSIQKKQKLLKLAKNYGAYIIEIDVFGDLLPRGHEYLPLYSLSQNQNVIYIKYFSHLYLPELPYFFIILPQSLMNIHFNPWQYQLIDSFFHQYLANKIWQNHQALIAEDFANRYNYLMGLVDTYLHPYLSYTCKLGGIYVWLTLHHPTMTENRFCDELLKKQVLITPGSLFFSHKPGATYVRLSITRTDKAQIEKGINIIHSILKS